MRPCRLVLIGMMIAGLALLAGCATPTPYQPLNGGEGYSNQQIEAQRFRVSFYGNSLTPRNTVEDYLLYRAAEITVDHGYDLFTVVDRSTEPVTQYIGSFGVGTGFGGFYDPFYSPYGFGMSTGSATPVTSYQATMTIVLSRGKKAADALHTYDAHDVMQRLGQYIRRPGRKTRRTSS